MAAVVSAALAALLTGCSGGESADARKSGAANNSVDQAKWPASGVEKGLAKGLVLPIEPYLETYPELVAIQRAKNAVQRDCMARFGFDFSPPAPGRNPPAANNGANMERRYGVTDVAAAKERGYGVPGTGGEVVPYEPEGEAANLVFDLTVSGGKQAPKSYGGHEIPAGGCLGESDRVVGSFDEELPGQINTQSWEKAKQDTRVLAVNQKWSSCMKAKGYEAATPLEALDHSYAQGEISSPQGVSMAVADVECKKATDLIKVYFSVESRMQKAAMEEHQLELNELKKKNEAVVKKAAARG